MNQQSSQIVAMSERLNIDPTEMNNIIMGTIMPSKTQVSNEQLISFLAIANEYKLNPLTKEIYAFPAKGGGVQAVVSIDGWIRIINHHPDFNGMEFKDSHDGEGNISAITCKIYKKNLEHPIEVTEYMGECRVIGNNQYGKPLSEPWNKWPARMLRHKATIQASRYAFGLSGIIDPDEADRFIQQDIIRTTEKDITPEPKEYSQEQFDEILPKWNKLILEGKKKASDIIESANKKGVKLSERQIQAIEKIKVTITQDNQKKPEDQTTQEWIEGYVKAEVNNENS